MPCIANTIFFILSSELQGYCLVCEVSLPLGIWEHSVPGAWGRVRAVAVQPAFVYRGKLGCCFDSPVCCCLHLQLWENHKGFAQIPLTTGACISNDQNSVAPGGRQLISSIFSNNLHVPGSRSLLARVTHLAVVLWRAGTWFVDCFTFSLGLVPRSSRSQTLQVRGTLADARNKSRESPSSSVEFLWLCLLRREWKQEENNYGVLLTPALATSRSWRNPLQLCTSYYFDMISTCHLWIVFLML